MKRLLFEVHRWLGIALALFMLIWFFSGLLIIYAGSTTPEHAERWAHADGLNPETSWLSAGEAWERSAAQRKEWVKRKPATTNGRNSEHGEESNRSAEEHSSKSPINAGKLIVEARLVNQVDRPTWLIEDGKGQRFAISAVDGALNETSAEEAFKIAQGWLSRNTVNSQAPVRYVESLDKPAILRNADGRPYHVFAVEDGAGSELIVAGHTGEVVHESTRVERAMYWAGNWIHMFRPLELTGWGESRVEVLKWTAFSAVIAALTGLIVGWLRWRPGFFGGKTYSEGRVHPYRNFWFKWHFWGGLIGGLLTLSWAFSGFLNNNPWQLFAPANASRDELVRYVGGDNPAVAKSWRAPIYAPRTGEPEIVERVWRRLGDETITTAYTREGRLEQSTGGNVSNTTLQAAIHRIAGESPIVSQTVLPEYDNYYYLRFHRDATDRPLPVLKVELADAGNTYLYIDPHDGRLLSKLDRSRRAFRWLYSALHHWDFGWLYQRPLWDGWILTWILLGLTLSVTAGVVGVKRLVQTFKPKRAKATARKKPDGVLNENLLRETKAG